MNAIPILFDDPHIRTLGRLANGLCYPPEYLPMMARVLEDNAEIIADFDHYILSGLSRLPDTDRHHIQSSVPRFGSDFDHTLTMLSFNAKLKLVASIGTALFRAGTSSTLDHQWGVFASAWLDALSSQSPKRRAA